MIKLVDLLKESIYPVSRSNIVITYDKGENTFTLKENEKKITIPVSEVKLLAVHKEGEPIFSKIKIGDIEISKYDLKMALSYFGAK